MSALTQFRSIEKELQVACGKNYGSDFRHCIICGRLVKEHNQMHFADSPLFEIDRVLGNNQISQGKLLQALKARGNGEALRIFRSGYYPRDPSGYLGGHLVAGRIDMDNPTTLEEVLDAICDIIESRNR